MKKVASKYASVSAHYDAAADISRDQYDTRALRNPALTYPANYFRLKLLTESFKRQKVRRVLEVGVGEGTPLIALSKEGMDVMGFDVARNMVEISKENLRKAGMDPNRIFLADIQNKRSYMKHLKASEKFDGLMAMGVMPHVENDAKVIQNMAALVRPGGSVFIEFRNILFSLFTQNRYTADFILNELLAGVNPKIKKIVAKDLNLRLRMGQPRMRTSLKRSKAPGYDAILSKFHNPFKVPELFKRAGFTDLKFLWYHYHPAMPYLRGKNPKLFRSEAVTLEGEKSGWRGYFLCSAFVVEARKK